MSCRKSVFHCWTYRWWSIFLRISMYSNHIRYIYVHNSCHIPNWHRSVVVLQQLRSSWTCKPIRYNDAIFIVGDLNIHPNVEDDLNTRRLNDLFDAFADSSFTTPVQPMIDALKVAGVRSGTDGAPAPSYTRPSSYITPMTFTSVSVDEMTTAVRALPDKCCGLDHTQNSYWRSLTFSFWTGQPLTLNWVGSWSLQRGLHHSTFEKNWPGPIRCPIILTHFESISNIEAVGEDRSATARISDLKSAVGLLLASNRPIGLTTPL